MLETSDYVSPDQAPLFLVPMQLLSCKSWDFWAYKVVYLEYHLYQRRPWVRTVSGMQQKQNVFATILDLTVLWQLVERLLENYKPTDTETQKRNRSDDCAAIRGSVGAVQCLRRGFDESSHKLFNLVFQKRVLKKKIRGGWNYCSTKYRTLIGPVVKEI